MTYKSYYGTEYEFNDQVEILGVFGPPPVGRLIQIRKGVGAYGSDLIFIRLPNGDLHTYHNVMLSKYGIGATLPLDPDDSTEQEYTIGGEKPETGFVIEEPSQEPEPSPAFAITVTTKES